MVSLATTNKILHKWQKKLRLQDWNIEVKYLDPVAFNAFMQEEDEPTISMEETAGWVAGTDVGSITDKHDQVRMYFREAVIGIQLQPKVKLTKTDVETYIVHELLHIMLSYIVNYKSPLEITKVEQVITTLEALLTNKEN